MAYDTNFPFSLVDPVVGRDRRARRNFPIHFNRRSQRERSDRDMAFTMLEVMVATVVLVFAITSSIAVMQSGFQALDTARNLTAAGQIMENEMESLRLKNWTQIQAVQDAGNAGTTTVALDPSLGAAATRFTCTCTIGDLKADMKQITLITAWNGTDGRPHTVSYLTRYGKNGLNDYYYTVH